MTMEKPVVVPDSPAELVDAAAQETQTQEVQPQTRADRKVREAEAKKSTENRSFARRHAGKIAIGLAAVVVATGAAVFVGNAVGGSQTPATNGWEDDTDDTVDTVPDVITANQEIDWTTFVNSTSEQDQLAYVDYQMERDTGMWNEAYGDNPNAPVWTKPAIDNSGQQILDNYAYTLALSELPRDETGGLDVNESQKILASAYHNVAEGEISVQAYIENRDQLLNKDSAGTIDFSKKQVATGETEVLTTTDSNGNRIDYKDVFYTDIDGTEKKSRWVYVEYKEVNSPDEENADQNITEGAWQMADNQFAQDPFQVEF